MLQDEVNPNWLLDNANPAVIQTLIDLNLTFDALIKQQHCAGVLTFAKQWPQLNIVIDHAAKPAMDHHDFSQWQQTMQAVCSFR